MLADPYTVLGVPRSADAADIKAAYRKLALKYHPDRNPGDAAAEERFKEISEAYATLRDPEGRARFDRYGQTGSPSGRPDFNTVDWSTVFREADIKIDLGGQGVPRTGNPMFDALFGVMTGMMRSSGLLPGEDREVMLAVSVAEARAGAQRRVRVPGPSVCATSRAARRSYGSTPTCSSTPPRPSCRTRRCGSASSTSNCTAARSPASTPRRPCTAGPSTL